MGEIRTAVRAYGDQSAAGRRAATAVRWASAIVFVVFGALKYVDHASELASFRAYGLPAPVLLAGMLFLLVAGGDGRRRG